MSALIGSALAVVGAPPAAAVATGATPYVLGKSLAVGTDARMVVAAGHLYVSGGRSASNVLVLNAAGTKVADITGEAGASGMVASADGSRVYVALTNANAIAAIDTATRAEVARYTVAGCPSTVALSAGRLFYGYGCTDWQGGVASIDLASTETPPVTALSSLYSAPLLAGSGSALVVAAAGQSAVTGYTAAADGTLTSTGSESSTNGNLADVAISPDGSRVYTASGAPYQITAYALPAMTQAGVLPGSPYPQAVAVSPDGTRVAAGFKGYDRAMSLYDPVAGSTLWTRYATTGLLPGGTWANPFTSTLPGSVRFSADGQTVYGLIADQEDRVSLFRSTLAPVKTTLSLSVPPVAYGAQLRATATLGGASTGTVRFARTSNGVTTTSSVAATAGKAAWSFTSAYAGSVRATYNGGPGHLPSVTTRAYTAASKTAIAMSGSYKTVQGVRYYRSYLKVTGRVTVSPKAYGRAAAVSLWAKKSGVWRKVQTKSLALDANGQVYVSLTSAQKKVPYRFSASFAGDSFNRKSSATGTTFIIG